MDVISNPCWDSSSSMLVKADAGNHIWHLTSWRASFLNLPLKLLLIIYFVHMWLATIGPDDGSGSWRQRMYWKNLVICSMWWEIYDIFQENPFKTCHQKFFQFVSEQMHWLIEAEWCIYASVNFIIGSDNGLSPGRRQAIICTIAGILLIRPLGTNFSEILIGIQTFLF